MAPDVDMTVTFFSEHKGFAFAARNDTGASAYISPMLAEQVGLDRASAGRQLTGTLAPNTDDHGATATQTTPWRVMAWSGERSQPVLGVTRGELEEFLAQVEMLRSRLTSALARIS